MFAILCFLLEKDYLKPFELEMMSLGNFVLGYNPPAAKNKEIKNENLNEVIKQMCQKKLQSPRIITNCIFHFTVSFCKIKSHRLHTIINEL